MVKKSIFEIKGVRHQRHARRISSAINKLDGMRHASLTPGGVAHLEWDNSIINRGDLILALKAHGISSNESDKIFNASSRVKVFNTDLSGLKKILNQNTELSFAVLSGLAWIVGLVFSFTYNSQPIVVITLFLISILFGGYYTLIEATKSIAKGKFEIDFLMLFAAFGACMLGKWADAALLLFLFSLGHALEHFAFKRAKTSIQALTDLEPSTAYVNRDHTIQEIPIEKLIIGDKMIVKPNAKISADGFVVMGNSAVDESPITGESIPVNKYRIENEEIPFQEAGSEHKVYAGTINGEGVLHVIVKKLSTDSTLARLIKLVKEAESQKSPTQHLADNFEKYYVPIVLTVVVALMFIFLIRDELFEHSFYRAISVLIAASPCALAISTPSAVLAGIARAAKQGVLIKGGKPLEDLSKVTAFAFDKTGTLTTGKPTLTNVIPYGNRSKTSLLTIAASVESLSNHPLAKSITEGALKQLGSLKIPVAENLQALIGRGVRATVEGQQVHIGNRRLLEEVTNAKVPTIIDEVMTRLETEGNTVMIVHKGMEYIGIISVMDIARTEAKTTLKQLKIQGIKTLLMLTGDNQNVADSVANELGITHPKGNLLPEHKVEEIEQLSKGGYVVAMIGDGVNDAPAMARSTVGIAMGAAGSDVALETADIALMSDKLSNLPFAFGLSRMAKSIIKQNLVISLGMVAILVPLTIFGIAGIGPAVIAHEGSTIVVVLNALRLLNYS